MGSYSIMVRSTRFSKTVTGSNVMGWLGGNALDFGLDDHGLESCHLLSTFFFLSFSNYFLGFSAGSITIAYCI